jgi:rRNA maturation protein Nop10
MLRLFPIKRHPIKEEDDDSFPSKKKMMMSLMRDRPCGGNVVTSAPCIFQLKPTFQRFRETKNHAFKVLGKCNKKKKEPAGENAQLALVSSGICG